MSETVAAGEGDNPRQEASGRGGAREGKNAQGRVRSESEDLLDRAAAALTRKAIERALEGDGAALRLCIERVMPVRKDRPVTFPISKIESPSDAANYMSALLAAVAGGAVSPSEASEIARLVESYIKVFDASEIERRVAALEERTTKHERSVEGAAR
jgi:hypothetical protein